MKPLVAISCITYNQVCYIKQCLEGFVTQKTTFSFVAIVHDDASTDGTSDIIKQFADKYPHIIIPIYESENQWSKYDGSIHRIMENAISKTGAKYVAMCEGDDYWTDLFKLQKQVDVLEQDPHVSMVHTAFHTVDENSKAISTEFLNDSIKRSRSGNMFTELIKQNYPLTCTVVVRSEVFNSRLYQNAPYLYDYTLFLSAAAVGKIFFLKDITSCYRVSEQGVSNNIKSREKLLYALKRIQLYFYEQMLLGETINIALFDKIRCSFYVSTSLTILLRQDRIVAKNILSRNRFLYILLPFVLIKGYSESFWRYFER